MFKKILFVFILISNTAFASKAEVVSGLSRFFGEIKHEDIVETPLKGVYEVIMHNPIESIFVSNNGRYLIQGDIIDLNVRAKMSGSNRVNQLKKSLIDGIDDKDKIIFKADNEKYIVHVFTDIDCPYCKKLHAQVPKMNALGITVKYLASPLAQLHPTAQGKMEKIWCAADREKAMDDYKKNNIIPDVKACENPVAKQLAIATRLGVNGTPAIFMPDGNHVPGYMPAQRLLKRLENTK
jgi:thiol:disulfide interchange protein DsbC